MRGLSIRLRHTAERGGGFRYKGYFLQNNHHANILTFRNNDC